jgi:signal transduction histidine kinase/ActR/RegA family two-component response regulator
MILPRLKHMSVRARALWLALLPATMACLALSGLFLWSHWNESHDNLADRGRSLVRQLASASEYGIYSGNTDVLKALASSILNEPDVHTVAMFGAGGDLLVHLGKGEEINPAMFWSLRNERDRDIGDTLIFSRPVRLAPLGDDLLLSPTPLPTANTDAEAGFVVIEISKQNAYADQRQLVVIGGGVVISVLILALGLALLISRGITRPLRRIVETVSRIGGGALDARLPTRGGSDLALLSRNINQMAERLAHARSDMQREIDSATAELRQRKEDAERSNLAKTRFLAAASHDLRQPMHALGLFSAQLRSTDLSPEATHLAQRIGASVEAMSALLDSLLDISRLDAGATEARRVPLSIDSLFSRLAVGFAPEAEEKGLRFLTHAAPFWIHSDPALLEQLLRNLLTNAVRYTHAGTILLAARRRGGKARIEVRDSGPGIALEMQSLIFQEFVQIGNPERDREKGLGLGLAIVQRLARLLNHTVGVRSHPGRGAVFWVEVPITEAAEPEVSATAEWQYASKPLIFLVDDDETIRTGTAGLLAAWGCDVLDAATAGELIARARGNGQQPDLLICDHRGDRSGFDTVEQVRQQFGATLPALLLSGETDAAVSAEASQRGLPLLFKPVRPARLRATLGALLPASSAADESEA